MPRKGPAVRRPIQPDPVYQNPLVTQLINRILLNGKKTTAERIVYDALEQISQKTANDPVITLKKAVENVRPMLEVKSRRVGGASYQVPIEVKPQRGTTLAMRWLVNFSRARRENSMSERLVAEIMDAANGAGASGEAPRGHAQDGRGEPGLRPLPLVMEEQLRTRPQGRVSHEEHEEGDA
jgi:small subunit ribosomal protein S7